MTHRAWTWPRGGYLYVMRRADGLMKIGKSMDVRERQATLSKTTGVPHKILWVSKWICDALFVEALLKRQMGLTGFSNGSRSRPETFRADPQFAIRHAKFAFIEGRYSQQRYVTYAPQNLK